MPGMSHDGTLKLSYHTYGTYGLHVHVCTLFAFQPTIAQPRVIAVDLWRALEHFRTLSSKEEARLSTT